MGAFQGEGQSERGGEPSSENEGDATACESTTCDSGDGEAEDAPISAGACLSPPFMVIS